MDHFDQVIDWQEYDAPTTTGGGTSSRYLGSASSFGTRSRAPSITGPYLPPWKRGGSQDGIALSEGKAARVTASGDAKILGARPGDKGAFMKIQRVGFGLTNKNMEYLKDRFPYTFFQVTKDHGHDHPIAHIETAVACRHVNDTIRDGQSVLDLYGNPQSVDSFMARNDLRGRSMEALCWVFTEKDELRAALKWGQPTRADGSLRYREMHMDSLHDPRELENTLSYDVFLSVHTLYYLDFDSLVGLLALRPRGSCLKAVVHRHKEESGVMFGGDIHYVKEHGIVTQTNVATGERYTHRDMEWMFTSRSKVWRSSVHQGALTWTFKKVTEETWIIEAAWCRSDRDERYVSYARSVGHREAAMRMNAEALLPSNLGETPLPEIAGAAVRSIGGVIVVTPEETKVPIHIKHPAFFEYLATSMVGKPRDEERLRDLYALARRENKTTSTFPGAKKFDVPYGDVADHVHLAFHAGVARETMLLSAFASTYDQRRQHDLMAQGKGIGFGSGAAVGKAVLAAARVGNNARRSKDTFGAILDGIESVT